MSQSIEMSSSAFRASRPQPSLLSKLMVGFVVIIILFLVLSNVFLLHQLQKACISAKFELQRYDGNVNRSHQLEHLLDVEREATRSYIVSKTPGDARALGVQQIAVRRALDSLYIWSDNFGAQPTVETIIVRHERYMWSVTQSSPTHDTPSVLEKEHRLGDSLQASASALKGAYRSSLNRSLNLLEQRISFTKSGAVFIIPLVLTIALFLAYLSVRPPKTGTEKVSDGH